MTSLHYGCCVVVQSWRVLGSKHTPNLPLGLMTITRAWTQSLASLMSNFLKSPKFQHSV